MSEELRHGVTGGDAVDGDHDDVVSDTARVLDRHDANSIILPATSMLKVWPLLPALRLVVELGGVRAASSALAVQASAVSKALRQLEDIVGEPLFHRVGRTLVPTERAKALHREVRTAMRQIDAVLRSDTPLRVVLHPAVVRRCLVALDGTKVARVQRLSAVADAVAALRIGIVDVVVGVGDIGLVDDVDIVVCGAVTEVEIGGDVGIYDGDDTASAALAAAAGYRAWLPAEDAPADAVVHHRRQRPVWVAARQRSHAGGIERLIRRLVDTPAME
jgi:DNA-binding transcriptional LysR family regulator